MKQFKFLAALASLAFTLTFFGPNAMAQPPGGGGGFGGGGGGGFGGGAAGGGFNLAAMLQTRVDAMRPDLGVTNDDEWNAISPLILKVMQLQLEARTAGMGNMFGRGRGGGGGGRGGMAALFGGTPDPAADALDTAVTSDAPVASLKTAMAGVRESRRKKQATLAKAQEDLKAVVTVRQEAYLLNNGLID